MSIIRVVCMSFFIYILANCGSQSVSAPQATRWPSATIEPNVVTTISATSTPIVATIQPTVVGNTDDSLASGLTPEGYHVLGDMAAPITFIDYSDYF